MKLSKTEKLLVFGAGLLLSISSVFIFTDAGDGFFKGHRSGQGVGKFSHWDKDIRHKWNSEFSWRSVNSAGQVEENDYVFAGDDSRAVVEFYDGYKLEVEPQSLVKIEREAEQNVLAFNFGIFNLSTQENKKPIVIRTKLGKTKITLNNSSKVVIERKSKTNVAVMKVVDGSALVESDDQTEDPVSAGEELNFEMLEPVISEPVAMAAPLPEIASEAVAQVEPTEAPSTDSSEEASPVALENELQQNESSPELTAEATTEGGSPPVASSSIEENIVSPADLLAEVPKAQPTVIAAKLNRVKREQKRQGQKQNIEVEIANFEENGEPIEIEISNNKKFTNSKTIKTSKNKLTIDKTKAGPVYFRVKPNREIASISSEELQIAKVVVPESLDLKPAPSQRPRSNELLILPSAQQGLDFRWSGVKNASVYDFELSRDPQFKDIVASESVKGKTDLLLKGQFSSGSYFWRVRSATDYDESAWSNPKKFQLVIPEN
jgi:hypothetical protein